ncbi:MAG TPA: hypothetical protein H9902_08215 [Candidatus Stackebrandtia faecavium]|nr:hypothetical protein [Candidatus Stackebrandtia faecavium]
MNPSILRRGIKVGGALIREYRSTIAWFFGAIVAVYLLAQVMMTNLGPESFDGPSGIAWAPRYFLAVVGIMIMPRIEIYIAHGYTRREMVIGSSALGLVFSFASVLILLLWGLAQRAAFGGDTWSQFATGAHLESAGMILFSCVGAMLFQLAYFFTGMLLGAGFRRLTRPKFFALMLPMALPVLAAELSGLNGEDSGSIHAIVFPYAVHQPAITFVAFALLAIPVGMSVYALRGMPLRSC